MATKEETIRKAIKLETERTNLKGALDRYGTIIDFYRLQPPVRNRMNKSYLMQVIDQIENLTTSSQLKRKINGDILYSKYKPLREDARTLKREIQETRRSRRESTLKKMFPLLFE